MSTQLVHEWAEELAAHTGHTREELLALDYPNSTLRIELMDGSAVEFRWAFHLLNESNRAIAVFTEHCGHHVFPYHEAKVFQDGHLIYEQKHG